MQVRRAAAMDAGNNQSPSEGSDALALVPVASTGAAGAGTAGGAAREPAGLPCPRCDSTDTKFCYYNNYNLGQPRHFCKGCRRYWTRGGALRNVPVGGGTRKPSPSASRRKHQRASASTSSTSSSSTAAVAALMASATPLSMSAPAYATGVRPYGDLSLPFMPSSSPMISSMGDHVDRQMLLAHDRRVLFDLDRRMLDPDRRLLELGGSFTSLLAPAQDAGCFSSSSAGFLGGAGLPSPLMPPPASSPAHALLPPPETPVAHASQTEAMIWGGMSMSMTMGWPDLSI